MFKMAAIAMEDSSLEKKQPLIEHCYCNHGNMFISLSSIHYYRRHVTAIEISQLVTVTQERIEKQEKKCVQLIAIGDCFFHTPENFPN